MPTHTNKLAKFFKKYGKFFALGFMIIALIIAAIFAFQEESAVKSQKEVIFKSGVSGRR